MNCITPLRQEIIFRWINPSVILLGVTGILFLTQALTGGALGVNNAPLPSCTPIANEESVNGDISVAGENDCFTFDGVQGDRITIYLQNHTSQLNFQVDLFAPGVSFMHQKTGRDDVVIRHIDLTQTGPHQISVSITDNDVGAYTIFFYNPSYEIVSTISDGETQGGSIDPIGDADGFTFDGCANDSVNVTVINHTDQGSIRLALEIIDPIGQVIFSHTSGAGSDINLTDIQLAQSGTHILVIRGHLDAQGQYELQFAYNGDPASCVGTETPTPTGTPTFTPTPTPTATSSTFNCQALTEIPFDECTALVAFYNATDGPNWLVNPATETAWLTNNSPCSWVGTGCNSGHMTEISLQERQLLGNIPAEIGNLERLAVVDLRGNSLSGQIPNELGSLSRLESLLLDRNNLSGSLPESFANLTALTSLKIYDNNLSGEFPVQLTSLTNLSALWLDSNHLSGMIPDAISDMVSLTDLRLSGNDFRGDIPPELGDLLFLDNLTLADNQFEGELPSELGNLTRLQRLWLFGNSGLSGPLPQSFTDLIALDEFFFDDTNICIPDDPSIQAWLAQINDLIGTNQSCDSAPTPTPTSTPTPGPCATPTWTILVYLNGDNNLDTYTYDLFNRLEWIADNPCIKEIDVLWDRRFGPAARYLVQPDRGEGMATYIDGVNRFPQGELNMGERSTLQTFLITTTQKYTDTSIMLSLVGHGNGWAPPSEVLPPSARGWAFSGISFDDTDGGAYLSTQDIAEVLDTVTDAGADPIEVLFYDACLMGMVENLYPLREYVEYAVASENETFVSYPYDQYLCLSGDDCLYGIQNSTSPADLATLIVDVYDGSLAGHGYPRTMAAINMDGIGSVGSTLDSLARALEGQLDGSIGATDIISAAFQAAQKFDSTVDLQIDQRDTYVDLHHFAELIRDGFDMEEIETAAQSVMDAVVQTTIHNRSQSGGFFGYSMALENAHGLSIYRPTPDDYWYQYYTRDHLAFADENYWDEFLRRFHPQPSPGTMPTPEPFDPDERPGPLEFHTIYLPILATE